MNRIIYCLVIFLCGCSSLKHFNELVLLRKFGSEQVANDELVEKQEKAFKQLVKEYNEGTITKYEDQDGFLEKFGDPIFVKSLVNQGEKKEMWLYRRPTNFFDSDKVYLYFDSQGQLVSHQYERFVE